MTHKSNLKDAASQVETTMMTLQHQLGNPQQARHHYKALREAVTQLQRIISNPPKTPANRWPTPEGETDPFIELIDLERAQLALGSYTDDELAHAVFVHGNDYGGSLPAVQDIIDGKAHSPIAYLNAAKERIRWLSRKVLQMTQRWEMLPYADAIKESIKRLHAGERVSIYVARNGKKAELYVELGNIPFAEVVGIEPSKEVVIDRATLVKAIGTDDIEAWIEERLKAAA